MREDIKLKWVKALRSGEYEQGNGSLKRTSEGGVNQYCCLGVLCDISDSHGSFEQSNYDAPNEYTFRYGSDEWDVSTGYLPAKMLLDYKITHDSQTDLVRMNDVSGLTFDQIADYIETNL